jgi:VanZ family protein
MQDASSKTREAGGKTHVADNMQHGWLAVRRWSFVVLWMGVIFWFSAQPKAALDLGQSTLVSKLAHVTEYAILGWLIQWARGGRNRQRVGWLSWLIAVLYAVTDEYHQSFTPGRTPAVTDVIIDSLGAAIGVGLAVWRS